MPSNARVGWVESTAVLFLVTRTRLHNCTCIIMLSYTYIHIHAHTLTQAGLVPLTRVEPTSSIAVQTTLSRCSTFSDMANSFSMKESTPKVSELGTAL